MKRENAYVWVWELNFESVGVIIIGLGLYYLSNYLSCIFGKDDIWGDWDAWSRAYYGLVNNGGSPSGMPILLEQDAS